MRRRSLALAGRGEVARELAVFELGALEYALDIMAIKLIVRMPSLRPVPRAPEFVEGVMELRGVLVPVMDLRRRLGLAVTPATRATKLVIVKVDGRLLGLIVDRALGVHRVAPADVRATPEGIGGPEGAVFSGACLREGHLVLIIDLPRLLSSQEKLHLGDALGR
jgi:purine-binding chemotaxis protein CheW